LEREWPAGLALGELLARHDVGLLHLDERMLRHVELSRPREAWAFLNGPPPDGWFCVAGGNVAGDRWRLYVRSDPSTPPPAPTGEARGLTKGRGLRRLFARVLARLTRDPSPAENR
jgi:hypothetical protein